MLAQQCTIAIPAPDDTMLYDRIANGTFSTDEAQAIAEEYLYDQLKQNDELWINDSLYIAFMAERSREATGYLYDAKLYLRAAGSYDSAYAALIDSATMQLRSKLDSITYLKDLKPLLPNHEALINGLYYSIGFLNQTINNLNEVRAASIANDLANASLKNDYAVPAELPEQNAKTINAMAIEYAYGNEQVIINNYALILSIAQQCPYTGGSAVERARSLIALINDSISYDDDNVCLLNGVYRLAENDSTQSKPNPFISVKPNPANNVIEIKTEGITEGICSIEIRTTLSEIVLNQKMDCRIKNKEVDISKLNQGIYTIKVIASGAKDLVQKLIIVR